jgi:hypothetical protein
LYLYIIVFIHYWFKPIHEPPSSAGSGLLWAFSFFLHYFIITLYYYDLVLYYLLYLQSSHLLVPVAGGACICALSLPVYLLLQGGMPEPTQVWITGNIRCDSSWFRERSLWFREHSSWFRERVSVHVTLRLAFAPLACRYICSFKGTWQAVRYVYVTPVTRMAGGALRICHTRHSHGRRCVTYMSHPSRTWQAVRHVCLP